MGTIFDYVQQREACRAYSDRPVEKEKIEKILDTARMYPTQFNFQRSRFIAITDRETARKFGVCLQDNNMNPFAQTVPVYIVITKDPTVRPVTPKGSHDCLMFDVGLAAAHVMFAATELGLSTCCIGWFNDETCSELIPIRENEEMGIVLALGYAKNDTLRPKKRKSFEEVVEFVE